MLCLSGKLFNGKTGSIKKAKAENQNAPPVLVMNNHNDWTIVNKMDKKTWTKKKNKALQPD